MNPSPVTAKAIAFLDTIRRESGLPSSWKIDVPADGVPASQIAAAAGLPADLIEGIFHNYRKSAVTARILPGDRVAFVPYGTPASHPAFFGPFDKKR